MKTAEETYTIIKEGMNPSWSEKDIAIMVAKIYAEQCCEDLRERIATISISLIGFEGDLFEKEVQDKIRNVEIILK